MDTELQNIIQGVRLEVQEEMLENDASCFENVGYTHCFEISDRHIKIEIDDNEEHLGNEYSHSHKAVSVHKSMDKGLQNINQQVTGMTGQVENFENDKSIFEIVDYTQCFKSTESNLQDIGNLSKNMDTAVRNIKQEGEANTDRLGNLHFKNNDNMYVFESTGSNYYQTTDNVDDGKSEEMINIKLELTDHQDPTSESENTSCEKDVKYDPPFEDTLLTTETIKTDNNLESGNFNLDSNMTDCVNIEFSDWKTESNIDEKSDLKLDNSGSLNYSCNTNITRNEFNDEKKSNIIGNMAFKIEHNGFYTENCDLKPRNFASQNHVNIDLQPIVLLKRLPDAVFNQRPQVCQSIKREACHVKIGLPSISYQQEHVSSMSRGESHPDFSGKVVNQVKIHTDVLSHMGATLTHSDVDLHVGATLTHSDMDSHMGATLTHSDVDLHVGATLTHSDVDSHMAATLTHSDVDSHVGATLTHSDMDSHVGATLTHSDMDSHVGATLTHSNIHLPVDTLSKQSDIHPRVDTVSTQSDVHTHTDFHPHLSTITRSSIKCNLLGKQFNKNCNVYKHVTTHSTDQTLQCNVCNKQVKTKKKLKNHMISHSTERPHQCNMCGQRFKMLKHLKQHMIIHSLEQPYQCNICDHKGFNTVFGLRQHMATHGERTEQSHQCNVCDKKLNTSDLLKNHMICHSTERPYQCNVCDKGFNMKYKLRKHVTIKHSTERPHHCNACDKKFKTLNYLRQHMTIHSTDRPYQCNICGNEFRRLFNLKQHMTVHSSEKPHQCNICDKAFTRLYLLRQHMILHSTEPAKHQCHVCGKEFKRSSDFRKHVTIHSSEQPHQCNVCNKAFKRLYILRRHMIIHSSERPHQCSVCDKGFKRLYSLTEHMVVHSSKRPHHQCHVCGKVFMRLPDCRRHIMNIHST